MVLTRHHELTASRLKTANFPILDDESLMTSRFKIDSSSDFSHLTRRQTLPLPRKARPSVNALPRYRFPSCDMPVTARVTVLFSVLR